MANNPHDYNADDPSLISVIALLVVIAIVAVFAFGVGVLIEN